MKLTATRRELTGRHANRLRRDAKLPAIVYGHHAETVPITLDRAEFERVFARTGRSQMIDLELDGGGAHKVLVKEVQLHPRHIGPIHVDLFEVSLREKVTVEVPLVLLGESPAVKRGDGDLQQMTHSLRVECLPSDLPDRFEVDLGSLEEVDAAIRAEDLQIPPGVTLLSEPDELIVKVAPRRAIEVEEEVAGEEAAAAEGAEAEGGAAAEGSAESERES